MKNASVKRRPARICNRCVIKTCDKKAKILNELSAIISRVFSMSLEIIAESSFSFLVFFWLHTEHFYLSHFFTPSEPCVL